MADNKLLIEINADAKNAEKAFDDMRAKTEDLEGQLNKVALVSGAAFAAFTAEIYISVKAFEEAQTASVELTTALQNQGIYTKALRKDYDDYADAVQAATGIDNDAISKAQAVAQGYLGQTKVTKDLTFAIADLGAKMGGDLNGAAEKIARTIGTGTNAFAKQGLVLVEGATTAERYAKVLEFVGVKAGGLAAEFNKADGYSKALTTSFGNLQEQIGSRFEPAVAAIRQAFIAFFDYLESSPVLLDLVAAFITAGAAVTGIVAAVAVAVPAFLAVSAAATAFGVALNFAFLGIPLAIGAIVAGVTLLVLNWNKSWAVIVATVTAAAHLLSDLFLGIGQILRGAFTLDPTVITAGLKNLKEAFTNAKNAALNTYTEITVAQEAGATKQNASKKAQADKEAANERQHQRNLAEIRAQSIELIRMQNANASALSIDLKSKEIEVLKALDQEKSAAELAALRERRDIIRDLQDTQNEEDLQRQEAFTQLQTQVVATLGEERISVEAEISEQRLAQIKATAQVEADIDRKLQDDLLTKRIQSRNTELLEKKKFGEVYARINKSIQSDEVQGTKAASGELVQLSNSKNQHLKDIGRAAAVTQIGIATAESAMNVFRGFSIIPIIGPALGIAAAIAVGAYGAERIQEVVSAADGGLITGGIPGVDSVPAMLMPGELVVPARNFDQVVGAVTGNQKSESAQASGGGGVFEVILSLQDDLVKFVETKIIERQRIGNSLFSTALT